MKQGNYHPHNRTAIWAITANGVRLGQVIKRNLPNSTLLHSAKFETDTLAQHRFEKLKDALARHYRGYDAHLFIMAIGIVVRLIAPFLQHKFADPAVVVMDEQGEHAVSLVSGHVGGANALACTIADIAGAKPVITTATDVNHLPAIDIVAQNLGMHIENPAAVAAVNMAIIHDEPIYLYDPCNCFTAKSGATGKIDIPNLKQKASATELPTSTHAAVCVDYRSFPLAAPAHILVIRPRVLSVGIGCNRNTPEKEIKAVLERVFGDRGLSINAIAALASIDIKSNEYGLIQLADEMGLTIDFFSKSDLDGVDGIVTPSKVVEKHVGVKSVCEAAAIRSALGGELIVTKQRTPNVTVAVARRPCISSV